jgi:nucleotide-binding universal stress UspA family protein
MTSQAPRIVVGVDGSGRADGAVRAAYHLARRIDATVELLHVAEVPHPLWQHLGEDDLREARERSVARLAPLVADLGVFPEQVREALEVRPGVPARELAAASEGAAWVFVGAHHREGPLDFGNNLRGLLAGARCPVWVQPDAFAGVARVRAASDLSERAPRVLAAARAGGEDLLLDPADRQHLAARVISPVMAVSPRPGRPDASEARAVRHRHARPTGAVLRDGARRHVHVDALALEDRGIDPEPPAG